MGARMPARSEGKAHPRPEVGQVVIRPGLAKGREMEAP